MRNIKTIFILVLSLILFAVSCSNEDKTGGETDNTETIETIDAKDFPTDLLGTYRDEKVASAGFSGVNFDTKVSYYIEVGIQKTKIEGSWLKDGVTPTAVYPSSASIENGRKQPKTEKLLNLKANMLKAKKNTQLFMITLVEL